MAKKSRKSQNGPKHQRDDWQQPLSFKVSRARRQRACKESMYLNDTDASQPEVKAPSPPSIQRQRRKPRNNTNKNKNLTKNKDLTTVPKRGRGRPPKPKLQDTTQEQDAIEVKPRGTNSNLKTERLNEEDEVVDVLGDDGEEQVGKEVRFDATNGQKVEKGPWSQDLVPLLRADEPPNPEEDEIDIEEHKVIPIATNEVEAEGTNPTAIESQAEEEGKDGGGNLIASNVEASGDGEICLNETVNLASQESVIDIVIQESVSLADQRGESYSCLEGTRKEETEKRVDETTKTTEASTCTGEQGSEQVTTGGHEKEDIINQNPASPAEEELQICVEDELEDQNRITDYSNTATSSSSTSNNETDKEHGVVKRQEDSSPPALNKHAPRLFKTETGWLPKQVSLNEFLEKQATNRRLQQAREKRRSRQFSLKKDVESTAKVPKLSDTFLLSTFEEEEIKEAKNISNAHFDNSGFEEEVNQSLKSRLRKRINTEVSEKDESQDLRDLYDDDGFLRDDAPFDFEDEDDPAYDPSNDPASEDEDVIRKTAEEWLSNANGDENVIPSPEREKTNGDSGLKSVDLSENSEIGKKRSIWPTLEDINSGKTLEKPVGKSSTFTCPWCDFVVLNRENSLIWHCLTRHGKQKDHPDLKAILGTSIKPSSPKRPKRKNGETAPKKLSPKRSPGGKPQIGSVGCPLCEMMFVQKASMKRHLKTVHGLSEEQASIKVILVTPDRRDFKLCVGCNKYKSKLTDHYRYCRRFQKKLVEDGLRKESEKIFMKFKQKRRSGPAPKDPKEAVVEPKMDLFGLFRSSISKGSFSAKTVSSYSREMKLFLRHLSSRDEIPNDSAKMTEVARMLKRAKEEFAGTRSKSSAKQFGGAFAHLANGLMSRSSKEDAKEVHDILTKIRREE